MKPGYDLDLIVSEKFLGLIRAEEPMKCYSYNTHHGPDGTGWYHIQEFSNSGERDSIWSLLEEIENRGWTFTYSTMKEGVRGHFVTLGYLKNPYDSFHQYASAAGESLSHAFCLAIWEWSKATF